MKKVLLSLLFLCAVSVGQSHVVNGWKLPQYGYHRDSLPNWAVLQDSLLTPWAKIIKQDNRCSVSNVMTITASDTTDSTKEHILRLIGKGGHDAGILLWPSLHCSPFIQFSSDTTQLVGISSRIGRNPNGMGAALFTAGGGGGFLSNAFQLGNMDYTPMQFFTGQICRMILAGNGNIGIALDTTKYDSLENHVAQSLWVRGGGIRCDNGYYDENGTRMVSSQFTTGTGEVSYAGNINSTSSTGSMSVGNGAVLFYGSPTYSNMGSVTGIPFVLNTSNTGRIYIDPNGNVTIYQKVYLSQVAASGNFADSAAAVAGGVTSGQIYHTNGTLKIMY